MAYGRGQTPLTEQNPLITLNSRRNKQVRRTRDKLKTLYYFALLRKDKTVKIKCLSYRALHQ